MPPAGSACAPAANASTGAVPDCPTTSSVCFAGGMPTALAPAAVAPTDTVPSASAIVTNRRLTRPRTPRRRRTCSSAQRAQRFGEAPDALVDLVGGDAGVGESQRVLAALEQEVRALDELHAARRRRFEQLGDVGALGQLDPHEVAAVGRLEPR